MLYTWGDPVMKQEQTRIQIVALTESIENGCAECEVQHICYLI